MRVYKENLDLNRMRTDNYHTELSGNQIQPYFDKLEERLVSYIKNSTYVVGCIAWLTNHQILRTLGEVSGVKIIINKEEYLNPNTEIGNRFYYGCLHGKYNDIVDMFETTCHCCQVKMINCPQFNKIFNIPFENIEEKAGAILTCGIVNNFSRMHHKFLIFFDQNLKPTGIWTGSYNLSNASNFSLENALYITDQLVIASYIKEFLAIYSYSESYHWKSGVLCREIN